MIVLRALCRAVQAAAPTRAAELTRNTGGCITDPIITPAVRELRRP